MPLSISERTQSLGTGLGLLQCATRDALSKKKENNVIYNSV